MLQALEIRNARRLSMRNFTDSLGSLNRFWVLAFSPSPGRTNRLLWPVHPGVGLQDLISACISKHDRTDLQVVCLQEGAFELAARRLKLLGGVPAQKKTHGEEDGYKGPNAHKEQQEICEVRIRRERP